MDTDTSNRLRRLTSHGYFPKELPPAFTTIDFGSNALEIFSAWKASGVIQTQNPKFKSSNSHTKVRTPEHYEYQIRSTTAEVFSLPKKLFERRYLSLCHPVPQLTLNVEIAQHWKKICRYIGPTSYSLDRATFTFEGSRAIAPPQFEGNGIRRILIEAVADWITKTDISRFYPSIYTHSIPWAMYGKDQVKRNIVFYGRTVGGRLDQLVRKCNRDQTVGIPIGPDSSFIIASIISTAIDKSLQQEGSSLTAENAARLQDDWFVGCSTNGEAEDALSRLIKAYGEYGFDINGSKTSVTYRSSIAQSDWVSQLRSFLLKPGERLAGNRLRQFLALAERLQIENPSAAVCSYALTIVYYNGHKKEDTYLLESFMLKALVLFPLSSERIAVFLLNMKSFGQPISVSRVAARCRELLADAIRRQHHFEAIWLLYILRGLGVTVQMRPLLASLDVMRQPALGLVMADINARGHAIGWYTSEDFSQMLSTAEVESEPAWLLVYESIRNGWAADKKGLMNNPILRELNQRNVVFYDRNRNVPEIGYYLANRRSNSRVGQRSMKDILNMLQPEAFSH